MHVRFTLYIDGEVSWTEDAEIAEPGGTELSELANKHMMRVLNVETWLMEVELLDDPDDPERFMRFGTDTSLMVSPLSPDDDVMHPWASA